MKKVYLNLPFQSCFSIQTESEQLIERLSMKYGTYASCKPEKKIDFFLTVKKFGNESQIITPNDEYTTSNPLSEIDRYVFDNNFYTPNIFALHGAAVEWQKKCHLFLAPTTSGKTTLTAFLTRLGFGYITDDCILLDRSNFCVHPFTTPIQLREGGIDVLTKHNAVPEKLQRLDESPAQKRFVYTPNNCVDHPIPLQNIFFIQLSNCENKLVEMPSAERMIQIMKSPITNYPITRNYLGFIALLSRVNCFKLIYSDMNFVKEVIQSG